VKSLREAIRASLRKVKVRSLKEILNVLIVGSKGITPGTAILRNRMGVLEWRVKS
jgi:hypothetical protein